MTKVLLINPDKCTGCRLCELACSFHKTNFFRPSASLIRIKLDTKHGIAAPQVCLQCETCLCIEACEEGAIRKDKITGVVRIEPSKCTRCKECLFACPHGAVSYNEEVDEITVCDRCGGNPECVKFCFPGGIEWVDKG